MCRGCKEYSVKFIGKTQNSFLHYICYSFAPLSLIKTYRMNLLSARSISLDSSFKMLFVSTGASAWGGKDGWGWARRPGEGGSFFYDGDWREGGLEGRSNLPTAKRVPRLRVPVKHCSGSAGSVCFWASCIRIQIHYYDLTRYGSDPGSGSFYNQAKILRKTLFPLFCVFFLTFIFEKWCICSFKK